MPIPEQMTKEVPTVVLRAPGDVAVREVVIAGQKSDDVLVRITHSAISSGTERLLWNGTMPAFPGLAYPLVPGYEAVGIVEATGPAGDLSVGDTVFVPGAQCHRAAAALFGASSSYLFTSPNRAVRTDPTWGPDATLLALAATAYHAIGVASRPPELVVGHGVLGRLIARVMGALGHPKPTVWERNPQRRASDTTSAIAEGDDDRTDYRSIMDVSGDASIIDRLVARSAKGGQIVLAGFYATPLGFSFAPAFMRETTIRIAAEFTRGDLSVVRDLVQAGTLDLSGLATHTLPFTEAANAYATAFGDPDCLKMILDWSDVR